MRVPVSYKNEIPLYLFCRLAILYILYILYIVHLHHCSIKFNTLQSKQHLDICMISYVLFQTTYCYISLFLLFWHKKKKITNKKVTNTAGVFLSPSDSLKPNCICGSYPEVYVHSGQPARWRLAVEAEVFVSFCVGSDNKSLKALLCILKCGQVSTAPQTLVACQTCCGRE